MNMQMLAVDGNVEVSLRKQAVWQQYGISTVRTNSMQEAIKELSREPFLFTAINADNINYLPMLKIMREAAPTPIFIITANYKIKEQTEALLNGADAYAAFQENIEEHILLALAALQRYNERDRQPKRPPIIIMTYEKLFVFPAFRQVFCNDVEIKLTKMEFDILCYLIDNRGFALSYAQTYREVWGLGYDDTAHNVLWSHMLNLRKKIALAAGNGYIENVRDVGYRLPIRNNRL